MGSSAVTFRVADTFKKEDAALLVCRFEHGLWDIWEEQAVFLDDCVEELSVGLDIPDVVPVEGELARLLCIDSCLSSSPPSFSSSSFVSSSSFWCD